MVFKKPGWDFLIERQKKKVQQRGISWQESKRRPFVRFGVAGSAGGMRRCLFYQTAVKANQMDLKYLFRRLKMLPFVFTP